MNSKPIPKGSTRSKSVIPSWVKSIPKGSHGTGDLQKRLWRLTSDCARIRDFEKYGGTCAATGKYINHWREGDAGHYKPYSKCNGLFKFSLLNVHLQSSISNKLGTAEDGAHFRDTLEFRYGRNFIKLLETENRLSPLKFSNLDLIALMKDRIEIMGMFEDKPDYYERVVSLMV